MSTKQVFQQRNLVQKGTQVMSKIRYVKSQEALIERAKNKAETLPCTVQQIVIDYKTDPEVAKAVVPQPLLVNPQGIVRVVLSNVTMHLPGGFDMEIGCGTFGVHASYKEQAGYYILTMPMTTEGAVVGGRETFGEPKKIAEIPFSKEDDVVRTSITRHGMTYIDYKGTIGEALELQVIPDKAFCFKLFPAVNGQGFEYDPLLVQLNITRKQKQRFAMNGELVLNESPLDPVADLPVKEIVSMEFEFVDTESNGEILTKVPAENLYPYAHQRYDDFAAMMG